MTEAANLDKTRRKGHLAQQAQADAVLGDAVLSDAVLGDARRHADDPNFGMTGQYSLL
jgi:hypothetical protein